jgi:hypothetical protein
LQTLSATAESSEQKQHSQKHEVVVLHASESGYATNNGVGYVYQYDGMKAYCSSSSSGAPQFPQMGLQSANNATVVLGNLLQLREALAQLLNDGYHIGQISNNGGEYVLVK